MDDWKLFGVPVMGGIFPFVGRRRIPLNRDGSIVDTGEDLLDNERGFYYVQPWVIEWMGAGFPISRSYVRRSDNNEVVHPEWNVAG